MEYLSHKELGPQLDLQAATDELMTVRRQQVILGERSAWLREYIIELGGDPDGYKPDLDPRNAAIYRLRQEGVSVKEIGKRYQLAPGTVNGICHRVGHFLKKPGTARHAVYKKLLAGEDNAPTKRNEKRNRPQ